MSENAVVQSQSSIPKLLKASDVANILGISRSFAYFLCETGQLPTVRIGHSLRVRPQDLEAYIDTNLVHESKPG
jgi:excisionase family DNA binding protein